LSKLSIIGQGYVGLTIAAFASKHHQVVGCDLNSFIVAELNKGISHVEGVASEDVKDAIYAGNYKATTDGTAPTTTTGGFRYNPGQGERNVALSDLFPGIASRDRLWCYSTDGSAVVVSHA
jgi:hypothetical protein